MVKKLRLSVLVEDSLSKLRQDLIAEHGLSILVEGDEGNETFSMLMDTGSSANAVLHNANLMGADLDKISAIFLSHGHYDHTGGLIGILRRINKSILVIAHPNIFELKLKHDPSIRYIGPPFKPSDVESAGGIMLLARNPVTIAKEVITSGEIERITPFEKVKGFWTVSGGRFKEDVMLDDQAIIINVKQKGLVVVSGCAHSGIINTVKQAQKMTGIQEIHAVLGGFHLKDADEKRIRLTINHLIKIDPEIVAPCHCTGSKAFSQIAKTFGDRCKLIGTGDVIEF